MHACMRAGGAAGCGAACVNLAATTNLLHATGGEPTGDSRARSAAARHPRCCAPPRCSPAPPLLAPAPCPPPEPSQRPGSPGRQGGGRQNQPSTPTPDRGKRGSCAAHLLQQVLHRLPGMAAAAAAPPGVNTRSSSSSHGAASRARCPRGTRAARQHPRGGARVAAAAAPGQTQPIERRARAPVTVDLPSSGTQLVLPLFGRGGKGPGEEQRPPPEVQPILSFAGGGELCVGRGGGGGGGCTRPRKPAVGSRLRLTAAPQPTPTPRQASSSSGRLGCSST